MDVFVAISEKNATKIIEVFSEFGFNELGINKKDLLEEEIVIEIGREPLKIQVLTGIDGVSFVQCYKNRVCFKIDENLEVPFIGFHDLLKNKKASPRAKDKIDLEELKRIKK